MTTFKSNKAQRPSVNNMYEQLHACIQCYTRSHLLLPLHYITLFIQGCVEQTYNFMITT